MDGAYLVSVVHLPGGTGPIQVHAGSQAASAAPKKEGPAGAPPDRTHRVLSSRGYPPNPGSVTWGCTGGGPEPGVCGS